MCVHVQSSATYPTCLYTRPSHSAQLWSKVSQCNVASHLVISIPLTGSIFLDIIPSLGMSLAIITRSAYASIEPDGWMFGKFRWDERHAGPFSMTWPCELWWATTSRDSGWRQDIWTLSMEIEMTRWDATLHWETLARAEPRSSRMTWPSVEARDDVGYHNSGW